MPTHTPEIDSVKYKESLLGPHTMELLGITSSDQITVVNGWQRLGAETYVTDFWLTKDNPALHLIAKACIKLCPGEVVKEWMARRELLQNNGVEFPKIFAVDGGTIIEEYIDHGFVEAYRIASQGHREDLKERYLDSYKRIAGAGFAIMSFSDVRSRGSDVVAIDVGEDLGSPFAISKCDLTIGADALRQFNSLTGE